ncbi:MAG: MOSC domain-containing protein [Nocardioides sp.]
MGARVRSINLGRSKPAEWADLGATSIDKRAVHGPIAVTHLGLAGDTVTDTRHHGGPDQAVYAFAREDLDIWGERLGRDLRDGQFAENLTTEGIDVNASLIGEVWRIGTTEVQVASVRTPCNDFKNWMDATGHDAKAWVKKFTAESRPGPYLRVLVEGEIRAGDEITVVSRPDHTITVTDLFIALTLDRTRLPDLITGSGEPVAGLGVGPAAKARRYVDKR